MMKTMMRAPRNMMKTKIILIQRMKVKKTRMMNQCESITTTVLGRILGQGHQRIVLLTDTIHAQLILTTDSHVWMRTSCERELLQSM
jgi:hypothetical protein